MQRTDASKKKMLRTDISGMWHDQQGIACLQTKSLHHPFTAGHGFQWQIIRNQLWNNE
jgi:hypothetical protein